MKRTYGLLVALALASQSCADTSPDAELDQVGDEQGQLGSLSLKLTGADTSGREYRLRNASFTVSSSFWFPFPPFPTIDGGPDAGTATTVSSETDPNAAVIAIRLLPGPYNVSLDNADWYLERLVNGAWEQVEQAVLLSSSYQYAQVYDNSTTSVAFRFGVDGELIDFRAGELQIGIEIEQPGDEPDAGWDAGGIFGGSTGGLLGGGGFGGAGADAGVPSQDAAGPILP